VNRLPAVRLRIPASQSIGVVTFNGDQQRLIENQARRSDPSLECVQRAKFPIVGFVKDPAGVAALPLAKRERGAASRQAGEEGLCLCRQSRHRLQSKIINGNPQEA
jgi:hypothetical protein